MLRGLLGRYSHETRSIELSRAFLHTAAWGGVVEVLKHELAHQFVFEVLCEYEALGIDARASGQPALVPSLEFHGTELGKPRLDPSSWTGAGAGPPTTGH